VHLLDVSESRGDSNITNIDPNAERKDQHNVRKERVVRQNINKQACVYDKSRDQNAKCLPRHISMMTPAVPSLQYGALQRA